MFDFAEGRDSWYELPADFALVGLMDEEPASYEEAMNGPHKDDLCAAYNKEISHFEGAHTWKFVDPPPGAPILLCRHVFKTKQGPDNRGCRVPV